MLEAEFQANVVQLAKTTGWLIHHDRGDYRQTIAGDAGFPDLVMARAARVIFAELKSDEGNLTDTQIKWLTALSGSPWSGGTTGFLRPVVNGAGSIEFYVWRPPDIDLIAKVLSRQ